MTTGLYAIMILQPFDQEEARWEVVLALREATGLAFLDSAHDGEPSVPLALLGDTAQRDAVLTVWAALLDRTKVGA